MPPTPIITQSQLFLTINQYHCHLIARQKLNLYATNSLRFKLTTKDFPFKNHHYGIGFHGPFLLHAKVRQLR